MWISVNDRLPQRWDMVLVATAEGVVPRNLLTWDGKAWLVSYTDNRYAASDRVTHWMPLPVPPTTIPLRTVRE